MASVNDILGIDSYQGQGYAGGNVAISTKLDTSPLAQLAQYTYLSDKEKWDRDNKKRDEAAMMIGKATSLDPTGLLTEQTDYLTKKKNELDALMEDPENLNPDKNPKKYFDFNKKYHELEQEISRANANNLSAMDWMNQIQAMDEGAAKNAAMQEYELSKNEYFKDGVESKLKSGFLFAPKNKINKLDYKIPISPLLEYTTDTDLGDQNRKITRKFIDVGALKTSAIQIELGMSGGEYVYDNTLTKQENKKRELQIKQSYDKSSTENLQKIVNVFTSNPNAPQSKMIVKQVEEFNKSVELYNAEIDKMQLEGKNPKAQKGEPINLEDGLQPFEVIMLQSLQGKNIISQYEEELKKTGLETDRGELAAKNRIANMENAYKYAALAQSKDEFEKTLASKGSSSSSSSSSGGSANKNNFQDGNLYDLLVNLQRGYFNDKGQTLVMKKEDVLVTDNIAKAFQGDKRFDDADGIAIIDGKVTFQKWDGNKWNNIGSANADEVNNKGTDYTTRKEGAKETAKQPVYPNKTSSFSLDDYLKEKGIK